MSIFIVFLYSIFSCISNFFYIFNLFFTVVYFYPFPSNTLNFFPKKGRLVINNIYVMAKEAVFDMTKNLVSKATINKPSAFISSLP